MLVYGVASLVYQHGQDYQKFQINHNLFQAELFGKAEEGVQGLHSAEWKQREQGEINQTRLPTDTDGRGFRGDRVRGVTGEFRRGANYIAVPVPSENTGGVSDGVITGISMANDGQVTVVRSIGAAITESFATPINALIDSKINSISITDGQIPASITRDTELNTATALLAPLAGATFSGEVSGITPTLDAHFTTKAYVDSSSGSGGVTLSDDVPVSVTSSANAAGTATEAARQDHHHQVVIASTGGSRNCKIFNKYRSFTGTIAMIRLLDLIIFIVYLMLELLMIYQYLQEVQQLLEHLLIFLDQTIDM